MRAKWFFALAAMLVSPAFAVGLPGELGRAGEGTGPRGAITPIQPQTGSLTGTLPNFGTAPPLNGSLAGSGSSPGISGDAGNNNTSPVQESEYTRAKRELSDFAHEGFWHFDVLDKARAGGSY